jgi:hypothetical protein
MRMVTNLSSSRYSFDAGRSKSVDASRSTPDSSAADSTFSFLQLAAQALLELLPHQTDDQQVQFRQLRIVEPQREQIVELRGQHLFRRIDQIQRRQVVAGGQQTAHLAVRLLDDRQRLKTLEDLVLVASLPKRPRQVEERQQRLFVVTVQLRAQRRDRVTRPTEKHLDLVVRTNGVVETVGLGGQGARDQQFDLIEIVTVLVLQEPRVRGDRVLRRAAARILNAERHSFETHRPSPTGDWHVLVRVRRSRAAPPT